MNLSIDKSLSKTLLKFLWSNCSSPLDKACSLVILSNNLFWYSTQKDSSENSSWQSIAVNNEIFMFPFVVVIYLQKYITSINKFRCLLLWIKFMIGNNVLAKLWYT